jgi:2-polyprenyl-3-methyl-5-hydroxy-6-metoxy-1,4-benzoquinol methylase
MPASHVIGAKALALKSAQAKILFVFYSPAHLPVLQAAALFFENPVARALPGLAFCTCCPRRRGNVWNLVRIMRSSSCVSTLAAFDALAPYYSSLLETRCQYLQAVEAIIAARATGTRSLLDIGSGNGIRALRIAGQARIQNVVLVEPSAGMQRHAPANAAIWKSSVSEISETDNFDLITCLWNVLGHLEGAGERLSLLARLRKLLIPHGMFFLDVNHRYNARSYGCFWTASRFLRDLLLPSETNGDVITSWQAGRQRVQTRGHVFTHGELMSLFRAAGLEVEARWIIDYQTGTERKFSLFGNLLYQLTA